MVSYKALNTAFEGIASNARYTFGNGDGCQAAAFIECSVFDTRYGIGAPLISDRCRDDDITDIFVGK